LGKEGETSPLNQIQDAGLRPIGERRYQVKSWKGESLLRSDEEKREGHRPELSSHGTLSYYASHHRDLMSLPSAWGKKKRTPQEEDYTKEKNRGANETFFHSQKNTRINL